MTTLSTLNYDITTLIFSLIDTRSLLSLALTSRSMKYIIIPKFLFAYIRIQRFESLESFCLCITAPDSIAGSAVDHFELFTRANFQKLRPYSGVIGLLLNTMEKMDRLRSVHIGELYTLTPQILTVVSWTRLRILSIRSGFIPSFRVDTKFMKELKELQSIHISIALPYPDLLVISPESDIGRMLLNSRNTLQVLSLQRMRWSFPVPHSSNESVGGQRDDGNFVLPHVHTLTFWHMVVEADYHLDLTRTFPSVRFFTCLGQPQDWLLHPRNSPFLALLESFEGYPQYLQAAFAAGAKLRRIGIENIPFDDRPVPNLNEFLSPSLRSLRGESSSDGLEPLAELTPNLTFLSVRFTLYSERSLVETLEALAAAARQLPLTFINCTLWLSDRQFNTLLLSHIDTFIRFISDTFSSLQGACLGWSSESGLKYECTYWRKVMLTDITGDMHIHIPFLNVSEEEGKALEAYHDWNWMDTSVD